ncbi:nucleoside hydrolase-like domain-containing protein [uncultured Bacteroides sp.]|jgi:hypothetical protein|uniref:nucleoside hydrolase-like domain-containing protein n=1 Tax=uncultured Bacteroides sp. TaxID=162156 RepID=UPI00258C3D79|nr:nucleoside hydrolase-like domain-containing protein [uncultured Bacteroides sp.]
MRITFIFFTFLLFWNHLLNAQVGNKDKHRLIVTTDLGGCDPDDTQSMIHLLLCSNVIDIEGLISAQVWEDVSDRTAYISDIIEQFGKVLPNLNKHSKGYPDLNHLRMIVKRGQSLSNMDGVGQGKDSPGSQLIISAVDKKKDHRPVWLTAWGGMNTIAQALWKVKHTRSEKALRKFISKIRIYDVLGQDDAGAWIAKNFPEVVYIRNKEVYGWGPSDQWIKRNIQNCKPLGKYYPDRIWAPEGDSPAFLYVYANGLNVPDSLEYGGWGGRFSTQKTNGIRGMDFIVHSGKDEMQYAPYYMHGSCGEGCAAINKWRQHIWNDFAARMQWTTTDNYKSVNHHPHAILNGDGSLKHISRKLKNGSVLILDASASTDPDGDELVYKWSVYTEPGTYKGKIKIDNANMAKCKVHIPVDAMGKNIHIILELTDKGTPALTVYRRVVVEVDK